MQGSVENLVAVEARRTRAEKRSRNDDSTSQSSVPSSPPSSPPAPPWSKRPCRRIESDSTETESDFDDPQHPHIGECPLKPRDTSPDGEQPVKLGRARKLNAREPYKLRKAAKGKPLKDDEVKMSSESMDTGESGIGALLTPPSGGTPTAKPSVKTPPSPPPPPPDEESPKQIPNPTPPETPQTDSQSENGILKRMLSQESSPAAKKSQSSEDSTHSPSTSRKKPPVSSRTRAQTKFENVRKAPGMIMLLLCVCTPTYM